MLVKRPGHKVGHSPTSWSWPFIFIMKLATHLHHEVGHLSTSWSWPLISIMELATHLHHEVCHSSPSWSWPLTYPSPVWAHCLGRDCLYICINSCTLGQMMARRLEADFLPLRPDFAAHNRPCKIYGGPSSMGIDFSPSLIPAVRCNLLFIHHIVK
jgi:hypothetical protein